jgi:uncharacterized protein
METTHLSPFHLMIKPVGPRCNLVCTYCYYLQKQAAPATEGPTMSDGTLEKLIEQYIGSHSDGTVTFSWQGGEPTLAGMDFFQKAVELQKKHGQPGVTVENTLQTNGTLLDDRWCRFLRENCFLVGLSVDGPGPLHDRYRVSGRGEPTSPSVVQASQLLRKHKVEFNTLTVVHRHNAGHPLRVYRFLRNVIGSRYMQFIPCVEPKGFERGPTGDLDPRTAPRPDDLSARPGSKGSVVTEWSVDPDDYGSFMNAVFDEWVGRDIGTIHVMNFELALASWLGLPSSACIFSGRCGNALAVERDGSVYSCDHFVFPEHRLGSIHHLGLKSMVTSDRQVAFGERKSGGLPALCRECRFLFACRGECPKNRLLRTPQGEAGLNYLCRGLQLFFAHADPWLAAMAAEIRAGRNAGNVMPRRGRHP